MTGIIEAPAQLQLHQISQVWFAFDFTIGPSNVQLRMFTRIRIKFKKNCGAVPLFWIHVSFLHCCTGDDRFYVVAHFCCKSYFRHPAKKKEKNPTDFEIREFEVWKRQLINRFQDFTTLAIHRTKLFFVPGCKCVYFCFKVRHFNRLSYGDCLTFGV